ncbi:hypothetical protein [Escherichia marmotae]|uniref:hypothetical protein n=1 Tax=Escherichia marmotae TaxID=1499973 RepID=UPI002F3366BF
MNVRTYYLLSAILMFTGVTHAAVEYKLEYLHGTAISTYLDSDKTTTYDFYTPSDLRYTFDQVFLKDSKTEYELAWIDGSWTIRGLPQDCDISSAYVEIRTRDNGSGYTHSPHIPLSEGTVTWHEEPVPRLVVLTSTYFEVPRTLVCSKDLGDVIEGGAVGYLNAQKLGVGRAPNNRTVKEYVNWTYKRSTVVSVSAQFKPNEIQLSGQVGKPIITTATLEITTSGGSKVNVEWPDVPGVSYKIDGLWVNKGSSTVSVSDGFNRQTIDIKVTGDQAIQRTYSIPVSITLS